MTFVCERFLDDKVTLWPGDCLDVLAELPADSFDSCVTDPPYHLSEIKPSGQSFWSQLNNGRSSEEKKARAGFMGKTWDGGDVAFRPETWAAVYRVLKPGAHLLAFGGTRTYHRMACAIEDAGFEIRDTIMWLFGSGFPKSRDVSKGIDEYFFQEWLDANPAERDKYNEQMRQAGDDNKAREHVRRKFRKAAGVEREVVAYSADSNLGKHSNLNDDSWSGANRYDVPITAPATSTARQWEGWGTALKPAYELIVLARKPLDSSPLLLTLAPEVLATWEAKRCAHA